MESSIPETFAVNEKANQLLLESLDEQVWRAERLGGKGRTIAAIFAHMHSVRLMWLKAAAREAPLPEALDPDTCTREQAAAALTASAKSCSTLISAALATPDGKVKNFKPNVTHFVAYLISHDAHHRGQISLLAKQAGHPLSKQASFALWEWGTLFKSI